ncbi:MAG: MFS transporter [Candidatus Thorarchaeota archaeon]
MVVTEGGITTESPPMVPQHNIWGILLGFSLFHIAQSIFWQFGSYYLFAGIGESAFLLIGLIGGLPVLVGLVGVYLWGMFSDRWRRRLPFSLLGFFAQSVCFFLYMFIQDSISFLIATCLASFFSIAAVPMANAYLTEARTLKGRTVGLLLSTRSLGWAFGAFSGGLLFGLIGMSGLFLFGALAYLIGGIIILLFVRELPPAHNLEIHEQNQPKIFLKLTRKLMFRILLIISVAVAIGSIGVNGFSFFFGVYLISEISGTPFMVGLANGFASLAGLGVTLLAGTTSDRFGRKPVILLGFLGYALFMLVYMFILNPLTATILWIIPLYPLVYTASYAAAADLSDVERRGRAMSTIATANSLGLGIGPIIGGFLVQNLFITLRGNMVFALTMNLIAFVLVLVLVPETRHDQESN